MSICQYVIGFQFNQTFPHSVRHFRRERKVECFKNSFYARFVIHVYKCSSRMQNGGKRRYKSRESKVRKIKYSDD